MTQKAIRYLIVLLLGMKRRSSMWIAWQNIAVNGKGFVKKTLANASRQEIYGYHFHDNPHPHSTDLAPSNYRICFPLSPSK